MLSLPAQRNSWTPYTQPDPSTDSAFEPAPQVPADPLANNPLADDTVTPGLTPKVECLVGIPEISTPGPLPAIPAICFFKKSYGYAILGFVVMSAGVFVMAAGVFVLVKTDQTALQAAGMANPVRSPAAGFSGKTVARKVDRQGIRATRKTENAKKEGS